MIKHLMSRTMTISLMSERLHIARVARLLIRSFSSLAGSLDGLQQSSARNTFDCLMSMFLYDKAFDWRLVVIRLVWRYMTASVAIIGMHVKQFVPFPKCCCHAPSPDRLILIAFVAIPTRYLGYLPLRPGAAEIAQHDSKPPTVFLLH